MNENEEVVIDTTNDTEETENDIEINLDEEVDVETLKKENATLKAQKDHWKQKATKVVEKPVVESKDDNLSIRDLYALQNAKVHEDDIEEVIEFAKFKKIPISEALKSTVIKSLLSEKGEMRNTANASNAGKVRAGSSKVSEDTLIAKAEKGEMPESDEDIIRLAKARKGIK